MLDDLILVCNNTLGCNLALGSGGIILLFATLLGGVISSLSPCTLGILPLIISYVAGYSKKTPFETFVQLLSFSLGLAFVMSVVGVISAYIGRVFVAAGGDYWVLIIASLLVVLGLNLLSVLDLHFPQFIKQMPVNKAGGLFAFPFLIGILFALASTPCSTPILVSIMGFASLSNNILYSMGLLFMFAMGQAVIIIVLGVFTSAIKNAKKLANLSGIIMKLAGVLFILCGIYMYYRVFSQF